jgi:hypothetical protein
VTIDGGHESGAGERMARALVAIARKTQSLNASSWTRMGFEIRSSRIATPPRFTAALHLVNE